MDQVATKKARQDSDFSLCIQCQVQNAHKLVSEPSLRHTQSSYNSSMREDSMEMLSIHRLVDN